MPLSKRTTLLIAGRRSYADIYSSYLVDDLLENQASEKIAPDKDQSIVQLKPGYYFYDYNAKLSFFKSDQEKMSVSFFGAKDFLSSAGEGNNKQTYAKTTDEANWGNYGFSVSWIKQWKEKLFSNFQIGYSGYQNEYDNLTVVNSFWKSTSDQINQFSSYDENKLNDFSLSLKNSYSINLKNLIDFGVQTKFNEVTYQKNAGKEAYYADIANSSWLSSSFIQLRTQAISDLSLKFGGRISLYNHSSRLYFEPRFSGNYRLTDRFSLKFATGKYFQFLSKVTPTQSYGYNRDFWMISDDDKHPILSSDHYIVGSTFTYKNFSFDLETYYKTINGLQLFLYIPPFQKNVDSGSFPPQGQSKKTQLPGKFINGEGSSIGLDLLLKYESNNFTSWISYSRSKSIRNFKEINGNENIPASYDRAHEFKLTNLLTLGKWNLSGMWIYSTGQPYVVEQKVDKSLIATFKYGRLPDYKRFDVSVNYNFNVRRVRMKVGVSVINLFNTNNFNDIYSRDFNFDSTSFNETSYVRSLGLTPNFFINFQY